MGCARRRIKSAFDTVGYKELVSPKISLARRIIIPSLRAASVWLPVPSSRLSLYKWVSRGNTKDPRELLLCPRYFGWTYLEPDIGCTATKY